MSQVDASRAATCAARGHKWACRMPATVGDKCTLHAVGLKPAKRVLACSYCLEEGHNRRTCYKRERDEGRRA